VLLAVSDFIGMEMWLICLILALSLTLFNAIYDLITTKNIKPVLHSLKKEPYELIPFVLSMFIIVLALKDCGFTDILAKALIKGGKTDGILFGILSSLGANLLNNIPMSVLFEKIISGTSISAVYGAVIGSNIGAFITPVGALAGIMWSKILSRHNVKLPFYKFVLYGTAVAIPSLMASVLGLILVV
jgi:arsenical pump membrane protein